MSKKTIIVFIATVSALLFICEHHNPFNSKSPDYIPPKVTITGINEVEESDSTASETITVQVSGNRPEVDIRYAVDSVWSEWIEDFEADSIVILIPATGKHVITMQGRYDKESATYDTSFTVYKVEPPGFIPDSTSLLADSLIQIREGENCTLIVRAAGTPPFSLFWYRDTVLVDTTNTDTIVITNFNATDSGMYYSIVQGRWGEARSDSVFIRYLPPINHEPNGQPDSFSVNEDDTLVTDSAQSLLNNDIDTDNDSLHAVLADSAQNGTVTLMENGIFTYIPDENFSGEDSFTYRAVDFKEAKSEPIIVIITVGPVNDAPILVRNKALSVHEGASIVIDSLHLFVNDIESGPDELIFTLGAKPENGYIYYSDSLVTKNAVFSQNAIDNKHIKYRHNGSETTADAFLLKVSDANGDGIDSILVLITVLPVNDTPYIASKLDVVVAEGGKKVVSSATLVVKDNDNSTDELFFTLVDAPLFGSLTLNGNIIETGASFTQEDIDSGRVSYGHNKANNVIRDSLAFTIKDITGASVEKTFLFVRIGTEDDPPIANDQEIATDEDTPISITLTAIDPEGVSLSGWEIISKPAHGSLTGSGAIRSFTPEYNWYGSDTLRFRVNDGVNWSDTGIVIITVNPINDEPAWKKPSFEITAKEGVASIVNLDTLLDGDPEGDEITFLKTSGVGTLGGNTWSLTPGYSASVSSPLQCVIAATDNGSPEKSATITFTIYVLDSVCRLTTAVVKGMGTVQVQPLGPNFDPGTEVQVTAVPGAGFVLKNWVGDVAAKDKYDTTLSLILNGNKSISALFVKRVEAVTLNIGESFVHGSLYTNGYYFLSTRTSPSKLLRLNADSLSDYQEITFSSGHDYADQITYVESKNRVYVVFGAYYRTAIAEVDPQTMAYREDVIFDTLHGASPLYETQGGQSICNDGSFLYVVTARADTSRVLKYSLSTLSSTPVAVLDFPQGNVFAHAVMYEDGKLYVSNGHGTPWVARVNASTLHIEEIQSFMGNAFTDEFAISGNYIFLGIEADYSHEQSGKILRLDKSDFDSYYYFDTGNKGSATTGNGYNYAVQEFNGTIWTLFSTNPGIITKINPVSLEYQNYALPYSSPNEIVFDGKRFLVTYWNQDPGIVQSFDPSYLNGHEIE